MQKSALLAAIQREIYRHDSGTYVEGPPSIAQGGRGIVVAGCPACKKRLQSMNEFLRHLAETRCRLCWTGCRSSSEARGTCQSTQLIHLRRLATVPLSFTPW